MKVTAEALILSAQSLGFSRVGILNLDAPDALTEPMQQFRAWIDQGYAGDMAYLSRHATLRERPAGLLGDSVRHLRAIVVTMDYLPAALAESPQDDWRAREAIAAASPARAVVSVYARGRDYHKVMRARLVKLAQQLTETAPGGFQYRACVDSAPLLEVELARRCGLGWRGKHTLLLNREQGSMFFLGVLLTNMPLPEIRFEPSLLENPEGHCGSCTSCMDICPTQAFVGPYKLDARRCISYLTIEHEGSIPIALRPLMANRVYGCDDCQRACPWNRYAQVARLPDFEVRHGLDHVSLLALFSWTETEFRQRHQGSAILRIGYARWLRNLAVAIGNALASGTLSQRDARAMVHALNEKQGRVSALVDEHIQWALGQADSSIAAPLKDKQGIPETDGQHRDQG